MKNKIPFILAVVLISACKRNIDSANSMSDQSPQKTALLQKMNSPTMVATANLWIQRYSALLDTNKMDPMKFPISVINDKVLSKKDSTIVNAEKQVIKNAGFPVVNSLTQVRSLNVTDGNDATVTYAMNSMTEDFNTANSKYKNFVLQSQNNPYINQFKQYTSSLIIRKYLLNNSTDLDDLQYYTDQLINSDSQDYGIMYLALNKIKDDLPQGKLNAYKSLIANNPTNVKIRKKLELKHNVYLKLSNKLYGGASKAMQAQAIICEVPIARANYFINKINSLHSSKSIIN